MKGGAVGWWKSLLRRLGPWRGRATPLRRELARADEPILGQVLRSNLAGIQPGPWHRMVNAEWLGPYTPLRVDNWVLKIMRDDPQIKLGRKALRAPFFGITYRLSGGTPETRGFVNRVLLETPLFDPLLRSILNALDFGYQSHEVVWALDDVEFHEDGPRTAPTRTLRSAYVIREFVDLDPERVQIQVDEFDRFAGILYQGNQVLPAEKCLHAVHDLEWRNWHGTSTLKAAYNPWYWCSWLYCYLVRYQETKVNPPIIGTAPSDRRYEDDRSRANQEARDSHELLGAELMSLRNGSAAVLPWEPDDKGNNKWSLKILEDTGRTELFLTAINHMQALKLRALCIPERIATQDTETGSFALVREHVDMFLMVLEEIKQVTVIPALNQVAQALVRFNFGRKAPAPIFEASELARQKHELMFELVKEALQVPLTLADGRTYSPAKLINFKKAFESLNVPVDDPEDVAEEPQQAPAAPEIAEGPEPSIDVASGESGELVT